MEKKRKAKSLHGEESWKLGRKRKAKLHKIKEEGNERRGVGETGGEGMKGRERTDKEMGKGETSCVRSKPSRRGNSLKPPKRKTILLSACEQQSAWPQPPQQLP